MSFLNDYICAKTKRSEYFCDFLPFPSLLSFFTLTCRVCTSGLSYADVITKFPGIYRFYSLLVWGSAVILIKCSLNKCSAGLFRFPFTCETSWMILIWTFLYIVPFCIGLACEKSFRLGSGEESFSLLPPPLTGLFVLFSTQSSERANSNNKLYWHDYNRRVLQFPKLLITNSCNWFVN